MKEEKTKSKLPGLTELFRFTVVIGLLRGLWTTCQMFVDYAVFWGTAYAGLAAIDIGLRIIELVLYAGMLVYIALRKRTFLICFWADVGCRVMTLLGRPVCRRQRCGIFDAADSPPRLGGLLLFVRQFFRRLYSLQRAFPFALVERER